MQFNFVSMVSGVGLLAFAFGSTVLGSTAFGSTAALAQSTPPAGVTLPPEAPDAVQESIPRPSDTLPETPVAPPGTPQEPTLQTPPAPSPQVIPNANLRFPVQRIEVEGSTVLQPEIAAIVQEYEARGELTFEELLELRSRITQLYISNGYVTSGAFVPNNQVLTDGIVRIRVVEGTLEAIGLCLLSPGAGRNATGDNATGDNATGNSATAAGNRSTGDQPTPNATSPRSQANPVPNDASTAPNPQSNSRSAPSSNQESDPEEQEDQQQPDLLDSERDCGSARLRESYVRRRLVRADTQPVNQQRIEEALQLLQLNPLIQQVNAELVAGSAPGRNVLLVQVRENPAFRLGIGADNYQSPSIGSEQFSIQVAHNNLFGIGDRIGVGYGITEGLDSFDIGYAIPLNAMDGTLSLSYSRDESRIVEQGFEDLDIESEAQTFSIGFRQPLIQAPRAEFALGVQADVRRSLTLVGGEPFTFGTGPENGQSNVTVLRFSQDWVERNARTVLAARSQFSVGIDAFNATINDTGTDGRFFAWLGQFQWVQRLSPRGVLVSRVAAQLTPDSLLSLERFGFGGVGTVRGYRQNQLVTDSGILGGVEYRFALLPDSNRLQLIPFVEIAHGWNNQSPDPPTDTIASVGLGLRWAITPDLAIGIDYGVPLIHVENQGDSLQDNGLYFSVRYQPF